MDTLDVESCDREPIHIPGSIQPDGVMLVVERDTLCVSHAAGDVAGWLGRDDWQGASTADLLDDPRLAAEAARVAEEGGSVLVYRVAAGGGDGLFDVHIFAAGRWLAIELERSPERSVASNLLPQLEEAATAFERAAGLDEMFDRAAFEFQRLTGYARVMLYRFTDDDSGVVVGECLLGDMPSFMHHHFPASDIPKQARDLYVRNLVRVIPDVDYEPAPLVPAWGAGEPPLDMSDSALRSVSPIHVQYLRNMGVAASASVSIVRDGMLWGLIACHNPTPKGISSERRTACRALAAGLARQIKAREDTDTYRERVRLRSFEDDIVALLSREGSLDRAISNHLDEIMRMLDADGVAVLRGTDLVLGGDCPSVETVRSLAAWALPNAVDTVLATHHLGGQLTLPADDASYAAGLLAITLSMSEPWVVLWFRAEHLQVVNWAGNPHTGSPGLGKPLTPRASFVAWSETVRGRSRRWSIAEIEAAGRMRAAVMAVWQNRRIAELNRQLLATLDEKDVLLRQKQVLMREVNHRVQNSLQLVSSFLALQGRTSEEAAIQSAIEEARRRISAVSLVHRRLYQSDQIDAIDAGRYFDELLTDLVSSLGTEWERNFTRDLEPVLIPTDRAVALGLVLTELIINANKYAYGGAPGPLRVVLSSEGKRIRLTVTDQGSGKTGTRFGFGSRMIEALIGQVAGTIAYEDNRPGTRVVVTATVETPAEAARAEPEEKLR